MDRFSAIAANAARTAANQALATQRFNPTQKNSFNQSFSKLFGAGNQSTFTASNVARALRQNAQNKALTGLASDQKLKSGLQSISQRLSQSIGQKNGGGGISGVAPGFTQGYHATNLISDLMAAQNTGGGNTPGYSGTGNVGTVGSDPNFGQFASSPGVDQEIQSAAQQFGVPANFLKSIIAAESSGDWNGNNRYAYLRGDTLLPYIGVFKAAADSRGLSSLWSQAQGNRAIQIQLLAGVLRSQYDEIRKQDPAYNWLNVASYHYSGYPVPNGWQDEGGNGSNNDYMNKIAGWWQQLDNYAGNKYDPNGTGVGAVGSPGGGFGNATGSSQAWNSIWGGMDEPVSQEFGPTDWSLGAGAWMYGYGAAYGVQGHPGVDVGITAGTQLYAPVGGTVINAGGTGYYTYYGNGGPGVGELRIRLDNGDELILGHMENITVQAGQRVNAGSYVGLSGGENGDHVHVEYRKLTPGATDSGFTAIDPRQALTGNVSFGGGGSNATQNAAQNAANSFAPSGSVFSNRTSGSGSTRSPSVFGRW